MLFKALESLGFFKACMTTNIVFIRRMFEVMGMFNKHMKNVEIPQSYLRQIVGYVIDGLDNNRLELERFSHHFNYLVNTINTITVEMDNLNIDKLNVANPQSEMLAKQIRFVNLYTYRIINILMKYEVVTDAEDIVISDYYVTEF